MTRDEGVALIKQQLGFRTTLDSVIVTNMQLAQTMLEIGPTKPWFLLGDYVNRRLTSGEERLPVPTDMLIEVDSASLIYVPEDSEGIEDEVDLIKDDYDVLRKNYKDVDSGPPEAYALIGEYFRIFPLPDYSYYLKILQYRRDTALTTNVENKWLKWNPYLLLGTTLKQVAGAVRDAGASQQADLWINAGLVTLHHQNEAREHSNRTYQMGGPH